MSSDRTRLDALVLLAALAARTRRIRLGVASLTTVSLRNPLQLAYQWYGLDVLSLGRMILSVSLGAPGLHGGAFEAEYTAFHIDPASRMQSMEEAIEILRLASTGEQVSYTCDFHQFRDIAILPRPVQRPLPIWIATATDPHKPKMTERALRRVARYADGWMTGGRPPETFAQNLVAIRRYAHEWGRVLSTDFPAYCFLEINDNEEEALQECKQFLDGYYERDFSSTDVKRRTIFSSPQTCIERLRQFTQAGATGFALRLIGPDSKLQLRRIAEEVLMVFK